MSLQKIILSGPGQASLINEQTSSSLIPLLDIAACGICATDRKGFLSPPASMRLPLVLGHEFCGTLLSTGKRVAVWPAISCGHCCLCRQGRANLCADIQLFGLHLDGGYQQQFSLPPALADRAIFLEIPSALSWYQASIAEPLACVIHSLDMVKQSPASICIYGAGLMGRLAVRLVQYQWPQCHIEVIDPEPIRQISFGQGLGPEQVELVFLACSSAGAVSAGLQRLQPGGTMLLFSGLDRQHNPLTIDYNRLHRLEQTLHGSYGCLPTDMAKALALMAHHDLEVDDLITNVVDLAQVPKSLLAPNCRDEYKTVITLT